MADILHWDNLFEAKWKLWMLAAILKIIYTV